MRITISRKIMGGFALIIVAMIALDAALLLELWRVTGIVRMTIQTNVSSVNLAKELAGLLEDQERYAQKYVVSGDTTYLRLFSDTALRLARQADSMAAIDAEPAQHVLLAQLHERNRHLVEELPGMAGREDREQEGLNRVSARIDTMGVIIRYMLHQNQDLVSARLNATEEMAVSAGKFAVGLTFGAILVTVLLSVLVARTITSPIRALQAGAAGIAHGSFKPIAVRSHDETADLARSFNEMSEKLHEVNEYRAEMLHHITHELRTPLQSLHSIYYLLSEQIAGPVNEKQRKYLETLRLSAERIGAFTNMYLDLAKFEAGKMVFRRLPTDLGTLIEAPAESAKVAAAGHGIDLQVEKDGDLLADVDPEKTVQVMTNLLSNAIKYTPDGGSITVRLHSAGGRACLSVQDSGVGIDPEDLPHLFTKFYQAKNAGKARTKGTGLGLALAQAIVEGQGGLISVASEVGKGTTVTVEFPLVPAEAEEKIG
jgi:signal transduction histidine kinase